MPGVKATNQSSPFGPRGAAMVRPRVTRVSPAVGLSLGLLALSAGACNIGAPLLYVVQGAGEVEAETKLEPDRRHVILIDDPANKVSQRRYRALIGDSAQETLIKKKLLGEGNVIDTRSAMAIAARGSAAQPVPISDIGEAVGADVVIYAVVSEFSLNQDRDNPSPAAVLHVKLFDVTTGQRLWPDNPVGFPLRVALPATPTTLASTRAESERVQEMLAAKAGVALAEVFYDVEIPLSNRVSR